MLYHKQGRISNEHRREESHSHWPERSLVPLAHGFQAQLTVMTALFMIPAAVIFPALLRLANTPPASVTLTRVNPRPSLWWRGRNERSKERVDEPDDGENASEEPGEGPQTEPFLFTSTPKNYEGQARIALYLGGGQGSTLQPPVRVRAGLV